MAEQPTVYKSEVWTVGGDVLRLAARLSGMDQWRGDSDFGTWKGTGKPERAAFEFTTLDWRIEVANGPPTSTQFDIIQSIKSAYLAPPAPDSGTVNFVVRDEKFGTFVSGATVSFNGFSQLTGDNGTATFINIPFNVNYNVTVSASGYQTKEPFVFTPTEEGQVTNVNMILAVIEPIPPPVTTGRFFVHVTDSSTGATLEGVKIDIEGEVKFTDRDGNVNYVDREFNKTFLIIASKTGFQDATPTHLFTTNDETFDIVLTKALEVLPTAIQGNVTVTESGIGLADVTVTWMDQKATTDITGFYKIDIPTPGSGFIRASKPGFDSAEKTINAPETGTLTVNFNLPSTQFSVTKVGELPDIRFDATHQFNTAFAGLKKFLEPGSPVERIDTQQLISDFSAFALAKPVGIFEGFKATHSPITPEKSVNYVNTISGGAVATMAISAAAGTLAEIIGFGQIETITWWLQFLLDKLNIDTYASTPVEIEYETGLRIPFQHFMNRKYTPNIPGVSDQIRFAVREAYPGVSFADTPAEMRKWISFLGFNKTWADTFWNAHWILPSARQLFEMRWRDIINDEELTHMLQINDIHPNWIERVKQITFEPARLVDIRTGWEFNKLTDAEFKRQMLNRGNNPADIDWIIASSKASVLRDDTNRIRTQKINQFVEGAISQEQLLADLQTLEIRSEVAKLNVMEAIVKKELSDFKDLADAHLDRFQKGWTDEPTTRTNLAAIGMSEEMITQNIKLRKLRIKPIEEVV